MNKIFLAFTLLAAIHTRAQNMPVNGVIKDAQTKQPLPFCNVMLHKSNLGVTADFKGNFKLDIPNNFENPKLIFTYSGYKADTVLVDEIQNVTCFLFKPS